jgi:hypothetical protein
MLTLKVNEPDRGWVATSIKDFGCQGVEPAVIP